MRVERHVSLPQHFAFRFPFRFEVRRNLSRADNIPSSPLPDSQAKGFFLFSKWPWPFSGFLDAAPRRAMGGARFQSTAATPCDKVLSMKTHCLAGGHLARIWRSCLALAWCFGTVLATAQTLEFSNYRRLNSGEVLLQVRGTAGQHVRIDTASELPEWEGWVTYRGNGLDNITDTGAPFQGARYYRAQEVTDPNVLTGDHLPTAEGDVIIHPLNHATFLMKWNDLIIYNDPDSPADYTGLPNADLILISHDHGDHFDAGAIDTIRQASTVIIAPQVVYNAMNATHRALTTVMGNGVSNLVQGVMIQAVPAYNGNHPVGAGNGYVLTIGGKQLYMSGDTGATAEMRAMRDIDVAFLCMNVPFTMDVTTAAGAIRDFRPRVVYPYHYRNSGGTFANFTTLKSLVGTDLEIEIRLRNWY
jgi:L-ascorbate metabolism protein UlaG (beta-lactamase superfamily)